METSSQRRAAGLLRAAAFTAGELRPMSRVPVAGTIHTEGEMELAGHTWKEKVFEK
jgi:hypothetical protein